MSTYTVQIIVTNELGESVTKQCVVPDATRQWHMLKFDSPEGVINALNRHCEKSGNRTRPGWSR